MKKPLGIALVVTLLFALLLFLAIVAVSSSLSLSGKRVTSNQKAALEAQYAAESGLALATTRLSLT
ncbi:PilX N-terminal domain-containing pilus assembly protein, partial [Oceanithermus sp.]